MIIFLMQDYSGESIFNSYPMCVFERRSPMAYQYIWQLKILIVSLLCPIFHAVLPDYTRITSLHEARRCNWQPCPEVEIVKKNYFR
jgi:hypothetical protein